MLAQLPIIAVHPFLWFLLLCRTLDLRPPRSWWQTAGWTITAVLCVVALVNPHNLYSGSIDLIHVGGGSVLSHNYGPLFWFGFLPWAGLLLIGDIAILVRSISQTQDLFRQRSQLLLIASLLPALGIASHFNVLPSQLYLDSSFISITILLLLATYATLRYRLFSLTPFPRSAVIERLTDGIIVLDASNRVIDFNDAAKTISQKLDQRALGKEIEEVLGDYPVICIAARRNAAKQMGEELDAPATNDLALNTPEEVDDEISDKIIEVRIGDDPESRTRRHYSTSVTTLLDRAGRFIGSVAIFHEITRQMELYRIAQRNAATDELTGFLVRRQFHYVAHRVLLRAIREQQPVSILVVDIDHFKTINDTYGHHAGDILLREAASLCRDHLRPLDVCARIGGDEFCILLPQVDAPLAMKIAERLRKTLGAQRHAIDGDSFHITVSIGVADREIAGTERISDLIKAADEGLYRAKRGGRDRVALGSSIDAS